MYTLYALWQKLFQKFLRSKMVVEGLENLPTEPCILASNHVDWLDGLLLAIMVWPINHKKIAFLARGSNWWIFGQSNVVITENPDIALNELEKRMQHGEYAGFFPEGYRNTAHELAKGKNGVTRFAIKTGIPVVPIGIRSRSGRTMVHSLRNFFQEPPEIHIGTPISFAEYADQAVDKQRLDILTDSVMKSISALSEKPYPYSL